MIDVVKRDKESIWHPFTPLKGMDDVLPIARAKGVNLFTDDGKKIIDAISSWWVNIHGHSNTYLADAISEQAKNLEHVIFAGFTHEPAVRLAERLLLRYYLIIKAKYSSQIMEVQLLKWV